jgi:DNA-binding transcriptional LysR family regulator
LNKEIDWSAIPLFLAVTRIGRLTVAARQLGIDHSTLGRRLSGLERTLNAKLFHRQVSGYTLTPQGERLLELATEMERQVLAILSTVGGADLRVSGSVRVSAPDGFGAQFLAPRLCKLSEVHPELDVELVANPRPLSLSQREADMAITLARPSEGRLHARKLTDYTLGLYATEGLLAGRGPLRTPDDLSGAPFIGYIEDLIFSQELDYASAIAQTMKPVLKSSNLVAQLTAALAGRGFCILPGFIASQHPELRRVLEDDVNLTRTFWLVTHSDVRELARVRVTAEFIAREVQENRGLFQPAAQQPAREALPARLAS